MSQMSTSTQKNIVSQIPALMLLLIFWVMVVLSLEHPSQPDVLGPTFCSLAKPSPGLPAPFPSTVEAPRHRCPVLHHLHTRYSSRIDPTVHQCSTHRHFQMLRRRGSRGCSGDVSLRSSRCAFPNLRSCPLRCPSWFRFFPRRSCKAKSASLHCERNFWDTLLKLVSPHVADSICPFLQSQS